MSVPPLDPQVETILHRIEDWPPIETLTLEQVRANAEAFYREHFGSVDDVESVEEIDADGIHLRLYRPGRRDEPSTALIYFHGGGWVTGSLDTHDGICRAFAMRTPTVVISVDYRLAPECRYPSALHDAWAATNWVSAHADELELDPLKIGVGGDGVGGTLATIVARMARDHGIALAAQLLIYPVTSHAFDTPSYSLFQTGYGLTREAMRRCWAQYLGDERDGSMDPDASPAALVDLRRLPRAIVITADCDVLRDEAESYAQRLLLASVETEGYRYDGMIHGFLGMAGTVDRSQAALTEIAASLRGALVEGYSL